MSKKVRLRGSAARRDSLYPIGEIPDSVVLSICKQVVYRLAVGMADITGDDFGGIFAKAVDGQHRKSPLGVADVEKDGCAWTVKTVQAKKPHGATRVRLISGRNSPAYSSDISDPKKDIALTGKAVLEVWNGRVDEAMKEFDDLRTVVLVRDMSSLCFTLFELETHRYTTTDYTWSENRNKNLEGFDADGTHRFTWQQHGSQFTVIERIPASARKFRIKKHPAEAMSEDQVLKTVGFYDKWVIYVTDGDKDMTPKETKKVSDAPKFFDA